ncbi:MAG: hypothetical protein I3273_00170 [Candidatus Moeniiplasma glomeromycotorum]|nr:hypothetical protein [Candidatus Moeniiplasma glomeromycotorum]
MKRSGWRSRLVSFWRKDSSSSKKPWRSLLGNLLLSNLIALVISLIQLSQGEEVNWQLNFLVNNGIGLTVWLFNLFFPWE